MCALARAHLHRATVKVSHADGGDGSGNNKQKHSQKGNLFLPQAGAQTHSHLTLPQRWLVLSTRENDDEHVDDDAVGLFRTRKNYSYISYFLPKVDSLNSQHMPEFRRSMHEPRVLDDIRGFWYGKVNVSMEWLLIHLFRQVFFPPHLMLTHNKCVPIYFALGGE